MSSNVPPFVAEFIEPLCLIDNPSARSDAAPPTIMPTLEHAIALAAQSHAGQVDQAGQPYILHPLRVMLQLRSPQAQIVAVLHDVIEDTPVTQAALAQAGYAPAVLEALEALTKRPGETRLQAAQRAAANSLARAVKLADNADNLDVSRLGTPSAEDLARLAEYRQVRELLLAAESVSEHRED